jgi:hypothetical protein
MLFSFRFRRRFLRIYKNCYPVTGSPALVTQTKNRPEVATLPQDIAAEHRRALPLLQILVEWPPDVIADCRRIGANRISYSTLCRTYTIYRGAGAGSARARSWAPFVVTPFTVWLTTLVYTVTIISFNTPPQSHGSAHRRKDWTGTSWTSK